MFLTWFIVTQVAIEAMEKKMNDLQDAIKKNPPDIKLLQLLLQGSISTQVQYSSYVRYTVADPEGGTGGTCPSPSIS